LVAAVAWVEEVLLGTVATTVATIAVAAIGLMMLWGRVNWRNGATIILGCFILFGASAIATGIRSLTGSDVGPTYEPVAVTPYVFPAAPRPTQAPSGPPDNDPYAGAAPHY